MMARKTKGWIIAATLLMIIGLAMFAGVMLSLGWDFGELSTEEYETNVYEIAEKFDDISINVETADVIIAPAEDGKCKVVCHEEEKMRHSVLVCEGALTITWTDERQWLDYIELNREMPNVTVYLPRSEYDSLHIKGSTGDVEIPAAFRFESIDVHTSTGDADCYASAEGMIRIDAGTGDIRMENVSAEELNLVVSTGSVTLGGVNCESDVEIKVSTGKVNISNVKCENLRSDGNTGDIILANVVAAGAFAIERSTGDVHFERCDAAEIFIRTDTGDVTGSLLSGKNFVVESDTGDMDVPKTMGGGKCEIISNTGDIIITEARK